MHLGAAEMIRRFISIFGALDPWAPRIFAVISTGFGRKMCRGARENEGLGMVGDIMGHDEYDVTIAVVAMGA